MIFLLLLALFHTINNYIVLLNDKLPLLWDASGFFVFSLKTLANLQANQGLLLESAFPPLFFYCTIPLFSLFGTSADIAAMTGSLFLAILIFATYGIGKEINNKQCGITAAFIISTFPIVFGFSRMYWLPVPVTAMTTLSIYILLKTNGFQNRRYSILLGITIGLTLLTKWSFPIYFVAPFIIYLIHSLKEVSKQKGKTIPRYRTIMFNLFLILLISTVTASIWYRQYFSALFFYKYRIAFHNPFGSTSTLNLGLSIKEYLRCLINNQIHLFYFILLLPSLVVFIYRKIKLKFLLISWFIIPFILFIVSPPPLGSAFKSNRFLIPALPPLAIIIAYALFSIHNIRLKKFIIMSVISIGVIQFILLTYVITFPLNYFPSHFITSPGGMPYSWQSRVEKGMLHPYTKDWKTQKIINTIFQPDTESRISVLVLQNIAPIQSPLHVYVYQNSLSVTTVFCPAEHLEAGDPELTYDFPSLITEADYILTLEPGYNELNFTPIQPLLEEFKKQQNLFELFTKIPLPEHLVLEVYRKR